MNNSSSLPIGTILRGVYRIEKYLSSGGFGNTYAAINTEFDERVAIKEFFIKGITERDETTGFVSVSNSENVSQFEELREKFKKEARRLRKLSNEHIVKVHDLFEENGTAFYVMDFIDGESLSERMKRTDAPFTEIEVSTILPQILNALEEVHQNTIWHLDLKPGNIMIDKNEKVYLIDFGASKQIRSNGSLTTSTAFCQTPGYAPTEQLGQMYDRLGPWTDIYALGATIYNLLTNKKPPMPFDIDDDEKDAFDFPKNISNEMQKLVIWMMQPKRKNRPQSVSEIVDSLATWSNKESELHAGGIGDDEEATIVTPTNLINDKVEQVTQIVQEDDDSLDEEAKTILCVSKEKGQTLLKSPSIEDLPNRAIKVGDFIFEDGNYSDEIGQNNKNVVGVLFSYYGGAHGQILSAIKPNDKLSINGTELIWHEASIAEWVEIIQNLGHCKVNFTSWEYRFYANNVQQVLKKYQITAPRYATRKSVSGVAYIINFERLTMIPNDNEHTTLPYLYISEF